MKHYPKLLYSILRSGFIVLGLSIAPLAHTQPAVPEIVTTTTHITDLTQLICGEHCNVTPLIGVGVDPHLYKPTESDIRAMSQADAVFYNGLHLEGQFGEVLEALSARGILTYAVSDPVTEAGFTLQAFEGDEATSDPHIWNDPLNWALIAEGLAEQLAILNPAAAADFSDNAQAYIEQLEALNSWVLTALSQVPDDQRLLVTSHDAFQYYAVAFGWEVAAIQGISTASEAGVGDIQAIVDLVVENQLPAIFVESSVPPNTIQAVVAGAGSRGWDVQIGVRELYSDSLGNPDDFAGTYMGMIVTNTTTILQSYGYPVPDLPEALTLVLPPELVLEVQQEG